MVYFNLNEMTRSATAKRLGIDNTPDKQAERNLVALVEKVLDPLRKLYGKPIVVTSGYRSPALNRAVGGARASQHCTGEAADIRSLSDTREDNMELLRVLLGSGLVFDQIICEFPDGKGRPDWIHVSYKRIGNRGSKLTARRIGGSTQYSVGIKL